MARIYKKNVKIFGASIFLLSRNFDEIKLENDEKS